MVRSSRGPWLLKRLREEVQEGFRGAAGLPLLDLLLRLFLSLLSYCLLLLLLLLMVPVASSVNFFLWVYVEPFVLTMSMQSQAAFNYVQMYKPECTCIAALIFFYRSGVRGHPA